jgi:hypothetical protein
LQLQQRGIGPHPIASSSMPHKQQHVSDGIWQTLRSAVMRMDRSDELLAAAENRDLSHFIDVFHRLAPAPHQYASSINM